MTNASDSGDRLSRSIELILPSGLEDPDSKFLMTESVDRIMLAEARTGEFRLAYLRIAVVAPYLLITLYALFDRAPGASASPLIAPVVLGVMWVGGSIALAIAMRGGWYRRWVPLVAPFVDATLILTGYILWWRLDEPVWHVPPGEVLSYVTALCAFVSLSGALRLSRSSARSGMVLGVAIFAVAAATSGSGRMLAGAIGITLLATGLLSASVTTLFRRVVTDEVARATLARMYEEAQERVDAREQVLKIVSHDLRNPLHTISMSASLLLDLPVPPHQLGDHLRRIKRAGERMNRLIQDLLDAAKLEAGRVAIDPQPIAIAPLIGEAQEMLTPLATEKGIQLRCAVGDALPTVTADAGRILQVLSNLVGNAIKFTPSGGEVAIRADAVADGVRFSVSDTGVGIPAEQLGKIFGGFWQANPADRRGIGLGLTIAKGIVEAHGGRIGVESRVGAGTTFHFTLGTVLPATTGAPERRTDQDAARAV